MSKTLKKMAVIFAGTLIVASTLSIGAIAASGVVEAPVDAKAQMGKVRIDLALSEPEQQLIDLGERYEQRYTIENDGADCYVRLDVRAEMGEKEVQLEQDPQANEGWQLGLDGYWYYTRPLLSGESVTFTGAVYYPIEEEWLSDLEIGGVYRLQEVVYAHATQSANLTLDMDAADPWVGRDDEQITVVATGCGVEA